MSAYVGSSKNLKDLKGVGIERLNLSLSLSLPRSLSRLLSLSPLLSLSLSPSLSLPFSLSLYLSLALSIFLENLEVALAPVEGVAVERPQRDRQNETQQPSWRTRNLSACWIQGGVTWRERDMVGQ